MLCATAGLTLMAASPVAAQEEEAAETQILEGAEAEEFDEAMAMLGQLFATEPLTEEQMARLPLAEQIIDKMIPDGTLAEMMGGMMDDFLGPIMELEGPASNSTVAEQIGVTVEDLALGTEDSAELASLFDPAWEERHKRSMAAFPDLLSEMMTIMEPSMRRAMSELYAINFEEPQLTEIHAFFSTETGAEFARKSFTMATDPRIVSVTLESLPAMMEPFADFAARIEEQNADLPAIRSFAQLSDEERARIAELTGYSIDEIEANLPAAEEEF
jgi:hypothetical protein